ncbi:KLTH0B00462p [Lachancea thermotolerans CBS 6340]|uniref:KLTH0B00462p n=1 Tax=Lachancea thermotolerans (strain ATCC 56472 / CBS 6340 / NRRL Y-8284) TaxID=559295 RepID=C5DC69_LACTC|nr:KLTH0B00462p [Lachancea thermotolerans CBS 6340]CAR21379.1 KLTH0B00462p [Lachancea thermotolerans CBS 6340]
MTKDARKEIKSVAIIGAGVAGLTSLFELLNTRKDGTTNLAYSSDGKFDEANTNENKNPAFQKIVGFELKSSIGGIWSPNFDTPDFIEQKDLDSERYDDPLFLRPPTEAPSELYNRGYTFSEPLITERPDTPSPKTWAASGIYQHLYSNVPQRYLRNSFIPYSENQEKQNSNIAPLITNYSITESLLDFAKTHRLEKHIRVNSEVVKIKKVSNGSWRLTVKENPKNSSLTRWYEEDFDAVLVSNGHYSIPYIPRIEGLSKWVARYRDSVLHSKSFREFDKFKNKRCLFVGTGLSGIDILQYVFPVAKEVIVSRTPDKEEIYPWLTKAATSEGLIKKPRIKELRPSENRKVIFQDGSIVEGVDHIIFSTGYHWHYPFLNEGVSGLSVIKSGQKVLKDSASMVDGLFLDTFSIDDPSLAFVGVTVTPLKWPSFELTASAIAGVWANASSLPSKDSQLSAISQRKKEMGENLLFHYFPPMHIKELMARLEHFLPKGRKAADIIDLKHLSDFEKAAEVAERLFYLLKNEEIELSETL